MGIEECQRPRMKAARSIICPWAKLKTSVARKIKTMPIEIKAKMPPSVKPPMIVEMKTFMVCTPPSGEQGHSAQARVIATSSSVAPGDSGDEVLGFEYVLWCAGDQHLPGVQPDHVVGDGFHQVEVVFDDDQRQVPAPHDV